MLLSVPFCLLTKGFPLSPQSPPGGDVSLLRIEHSAPESLSQLDLRAGPVGFVWASDLADPPPCSLTESEHEGRGREHGCGFSCLSASDPFK